MAPPPRQPVAGAGGGSGLPDPTGCRPWPPPAARPGPPRTGRRGPQRHRSGPPRRVQKAGERVAKGRFCKLYLLALIGSDHAQSSEPLAEPTSTGPDGFPAAQTRYRDDTNTASPGLDSANHNPKDATTGANQTAQALKASVVRTFLMPPRFVTKTPASSSVNKNQFSLVLTDPAQTSQRPSETISGALPSKLPPRRKNALQSFGSGRSYPDERQVQLDLWVDSQPRPFAMRPPVPPGSGDL